MILKEHLLSEGWQQFSLTEFKNHLFRITFYDKSPHGWEEWIIENKVYGRHSIIYRGKILSVAHFKAIMTFVKEDYQLTEFEIKTLKMYGNKEENNLQSVTD
jgi:hypothetical protein